MKTLVDMLKYQYDYGWNIVKDSLKDITKEEYWKEIVPNSWSLRKIEGKWRFDYDLPKPIPKKPMTIAWLVIHIATCKIMYYEYGFGNAKLTWDDLEIPNNLVDGINYLENSHELFDEKIISLEDVNLTEMSLTNWGEKWPIFKIIWTIIQHDIYHGAQIHYLRKYYRSDTL